MISIFPKVQWAGYPVQLYRNTVQPGRDRRIKCHSARKRVAAPSPSSEHGGSLTLTGRLGPWRVSRKSKQPSLLRAPRSADWVAKGRCSRKECRLTEVLLSPACNSRLMSTTANITTASEQCSQSRLQCKMQSDRCQCVPPNELHPLGKRQSMMG